MLGLTAFFEGDIAVGSKIIVAEGHPGHGVAHTAVLRNLAKRQYAILY